MRREDSPIVRTGDAPTPGDQGPGRVREPGTGIGKRMDESVMRRGVCVCFSACLATDTCRTVGRH